MENEIAEDDITFKSLGVCEELCEACERLNWIYATPIQRQVIPLALEGRDIIGVAETGSGKTAAFALPIIQDLLKGGRYDRRIFALVLVPTHELAEQVSNQFRALGSSIGLKCALIVGGHDVNSQRVALNNKPHIIVATPGRIVDHMTNLKGFNLRSLQYLVMDEADRMLSADFETEINEILTHIPHERHSYLFSATMNNKVAKLNRVSLTNPVKVEIIKEHLTVDKLLQYVILAPAKFKDIYFVYLMEKLMGKSMIIFCDTRANAHRVSLMLNQLDFPAVLLHGKMTQEKRTGSLNKFKSKDRTILVSTDVCSRGLDIPHVDVIINLDIPKTGVDYLHRVGRTARAGRSGSAYTFVTQYDAELFASIEDHINKNKEGNEDRETIKMTKFDVDKGMAMKLSDTVGQAQAEARRKMSELDDLKKRSRKHPKKQENKSWVDPSSSSSKKHKAR